MLHCRHLHVGSLRLANKEQTGANSDNRARPQLMVMVTPQHKNGTQSCKQYVKRALKETRTETLCVCLSREACVGLKHKEVHGEVR